METKEVRLASFASTMTIFSRMLSIKVHGLRRFQSKSCTGLGNRIIEQDYRNVAHRKEIYVIHMQSP
jgi:hypothetical protein